jgi:Protein of unknown function (DUF5132)
MKLMIFVLGAAAGFAFGRRPREILKVAVKGGMVAGSKLRELQEQIAEDIEDHIAEARAEMQQRDA